MNEGSKLSRVAGSTSPRVAVAGASFQGSRRTALGLLCRAGVAVNFSEVARVLYCTVPPKQGTWVLKAWDGGSCMVWIWISRVAVLVGESSGSLSRAAYPASR